MSLPIGRQLFVSSGVPDATQGPGRGLGEMGQEAAVRQARVHDTDEENKQIGQEIGRARRAVSVSVRLV